MPRRTTVAKATPVQKEKPLYTITLVHAAGECLVEFDKQKAYDQFVTNVTKRDLRAFPWSFYDMHGNEYILRDFIFCKVVRH